MKKLFLFEFAYLLTFESHINECSLKSYTSMQEVIDILQTNAVNYAILRNYENLLDDEIYEAGHGDVDIICENSKQIINILDAYSQNSHQIDGMGDGTHYYIYINQKRVSLDLRHVGDDYYCRKWEIALLNRSVLHNGFKVLEPKDYFYTLIYHAIFQKKEFSQEYRNRLTKMGEKLGINSGLGTIASFVSILEKYMTVHGYKYNYPVDRYVPLKRKYIQDKSLFAMDYHRYYQHTKFEIKVKLIEYMVYIYHLTIKRN